MKKINLNAPNFIEGLKKRDCKSISYLIKRYNGELLNTVRGCGISEDQCEEILQETWDAFFTSIVNFEGRSHIRTYLFGILYNKIKTFWRAYKKSKQTVNNEDEEYFQETITDQFNADGSWLTPPDRPERILDLKDISGALDYCLKKIEKKYTMAFYLKEIDGESSQNICNILGVSRTNLGVLLFRGKNLLRKCLERKSITRDYL